MMFFSHRIDADYLQQNLKTPSLKYCWWITSQSALFNCKFLLKNSVIKMEYIRKTFPHKNMKRNHLELNRL
jgi:hypothetical protein